MDEQIGRNILENFEVSAVENAQHEIHKLNGPGVLKAIENGSLQFITVPTRDSEFIDHTLLNPEYITTHLANGGFIIDLMENQDTNQDHNQTTQYIGESIGNELQLQANDDNDRRLTATLFQFVKGSVRVGNDTQVIVTNKDVELDAQQLLTIDDQDTLPHSLLSEGQFKIFPSPTISLTGTNQIQLNNQPLPQLTPIRRLSRQRKNSINNSNNIAETVTVQNSKTNEEVLDQNRYQRQLTKKVLPHKKRITKKLKAIDRVESQTNIQPSPLPQQHNEFYRNTEVVREEESISLNSAAQFSCQLCGSTFEKQLDFFSHLKWHYEPIKTDENETKFIVEEHIIEKQEPRFTNVELPQVELQFHDLGNTDVQQDQSPNSHNSAQFHENHQFNNHLQANEQQQQQPEERQEFHSKLDDLPTQVLNLENKLIGTSMSQTIISTTTTTHNQTQNLSTLSTSTESPTNKGIVIIQEELEFSDTEDMLEGIRGVVDKVQESVDDTGDEMDMISPSRLTWYSNSALNGEINFKQPRIQNIQHSYQIFFKNDFHEKEENENCSNNDDKIVQHAIQLHHHHQRESPIDLMHRVMVDQTQTESVPTSIADSPITNNVMTALHIPYQNNYNSTIKLENFSSIEEENTSQFSPNVISSATKTQKRSKKSKKPKKTKTDDEKTKNANETVDVVDPSEPKRSRGRPSKSKNLDNIIQIEEKIKIDEIIQQIPLVSQETDSEDGDIDDNLDFNDHDTTKKNRKKYICQKCYKVFNSINALKYHDFSHTLERPHQCDICGKSFFALNALRAHLRVHSGEKPFNCDVCSRAFRQWGDLTYHKISLHSNEKNFQCEFCGKAFARKYSLVIHRRIHTQERNYKCEFCPKTFRASSYLQNHRKIHTGEKPYICSTCNKKFRVCGDLKRHQKIHEREKELATHLDEIIKTEISPNTTQELIVSDKTENVPTFYCKREQANLLKTDTNFGKDDLFPTSIITTTNLNTTKIPKLAITARTPKTNKKNRKTNSKKLK